MPLLTLHLLQLQQCSAEDFLKKLHQTEPATKIVVASKPRYLVVHVNKQDVSDLNNKQYDLMLLLQGKEGAIPSFLKSHVKFEYKINVGIPSKLLASYPEKNQKLLKEAPLAQLTGSLDNPKMPESSQNLELSPDLLKFMKSNENTGPVTMLNLLRFNKDGKPSYYQYGQVCCCVLEWLVRVVDHVIALYPRG